MLSLKLLAQPALTNSLTYSRDLTNAAWAETGTSVAAYDAVGMDGVANSASTLTDDDGAAYEYVSETITVPDDSNTHVARLFIKKDSDETRFPAFSMWLANGTLQDVWRHINTKTGALTDISLDTGTTDADVRDAGDWWEVLLSVTNNTSGNTAATVYVHPADATVAGTRSTAATGSCVVGSEIVNST
jgi:hypothetical protein